MKELIEELVWSYRKLYLPSTADEDVPAEEYQKIQRESAIAQCALDAAFGDRPGYNQTVLRDMSDGASDQVIALLMQWTEEIEWPNDGDMSTKGFWRSTAQNAEEACQKTEAFMNDKLWPFTNIIR
jgi:hypothetical protein